MQQQGRQRAEAPAERSVEIAQAMVPLAAALAHGGAAEPEVMWREVCVCVCVWT